MICDECDKDFKVGEITLYRIELEDKSIITMCLQCFQEARLRYLEGQK